MSALAQKARSPAPVRMTSRTRPGGFDCSPDALELGLCGCVDRIQDVRPVDCDPRDRLVDLEEDGHQAAFSFPRMPSSPSTSSVCWPRCAGGTRSVTGASRR